MFGWFTPKCPVTLVEKTWTELRMCWLAEKLGIDRLKRAEVLLPTEAGVPDDYEGEWNEARTLLEVLGRHMGVDAGAIDLQVAEDLGEGVGQYELTSGDAAAYVQPAGQSIRATQVTARAILRIAASELADPQRLLAVLTRGLCHHLLLGGGLVGADMSDQDSIADLLAVFLGVGMFAANVTIVEGAGHEGMWDWWRIQKLGYLPAHVFGYAMALFAYMREEEPHWTTHLRRDAAGALTQGIRFLNKTSDSIFSPHSRWPASLGVRDCVSNLRDGSPTVRLATLWQIGEQNLTHGDLTEPLQECLADKNPDIVAEAVRLLANAGIAPPGGAEDLVYMLQRGERPVQAAAVYALGTLRAEHPDAIWRLADCLVDGNATLRQNACYALSCYGPAAASAEPKALAALLTAYRDGDQSAMDTLVRVLLHTVPNAHAALRREFGRADPEVYTHLSGTLSEQEDMIERELQPAPVADTQPAGRKIEESIRTKARW
jgi:hypothetical protein